MQFYTPSTVRQFEAIALRLGCPVEVLLFISAGWSITESLYQIHVDAATLCWRFHDQALIQFGGNAQEQLAAWGVTSTRDFGTLVYGMAEHGLLFVTEIDDISDFDDVFVFHENFDKLKIDRRNASRQWKLSTMFIATTLAAIVVSGYMRGSFEGVANALLAGWLVLLGTICIYNGWVRRPKGWVFLVFIGTGCLTSGLFGFLSFSY